MAEQGPLEELTGNQELKEKINSTVMEILRTIFSWFDLPWRELTYDNMFEKAKILNKITKEDIRVSKFVPLGQAGAYDEANKVTFTSKLQERLARLKDRTTLGGEAQDRAAID